MLPQNSALHAMAHPFRFILTQVFAVVAGAARHIGKWAKSSGYCGEVQLSAVPYEGADPVLAQTYTCKGGGKAGGPKAIAVKALCCP